VRGEEVWRGLSALLGVRLWDEGDADYADFEICLDCSMQNLDAFGAEEFGWKVLVGRKELRDKRMLGCFFAGLGIWNRMQGVSGWGMI
jgi:hypothetical protein